MNIKDVIKLREYVILCIAIMFLFLKEREMLYGRFMDAEKYVGKVVWFDSSLGYGFISRTDEADLFVYWSDIITKGYKTLKKGQEVIFSIGLNNRKQPKAIEVSIISEDKGEE